MKLVKYALIALSILTVSFVALSFYVTEQMMRPAFYALRTPAQGLIPRDGSTDPLQDFNIPFESVEFPAVDRQTLRGWFVPGNTDAAAAIITVHGGGTDRRSYLDMVPVLHEAGYPVLLFDNRERRCDDADGEWLVRGDDLLSARRRTQLGESPQLCGDAFDSDDERDQYVSKSDQRRFKLLDTDVHMGHRICSDLL